jgi:hypothetical protein
LNSMSDALMQTLLSTLGGGASPADALAALASSDPRLGPLVNLLQQRLAAPAVIEGEAEEVAEPAPDLQQRAQDLARLSRKMFAELKVLRTRNDNLAAALGACHLCWGEDADCPYCGGDGGVGAFVIDAQLFDEIVGPALEQFRQRPRLVQSQRDREGGEDARFVRS